MGVPLGCFNSTAQAFDYGKPYTKEVEDKFIEDLKHPQVKNACILGGEPFQQDLNILLKLFKRIKQEVNKPIWCWTGYRYEELFNVKGTREILDYIDILIDGRFKMDLRDLSLKYRGSSNQRVIDVQESLKQKKVILSKYN